MSRLYYKEYGHGDPILLIHGFGAHSYTWRYIVPSLAHCYRVIVVDLKGVGRSEKSLDNKYSIHDQACLVIDLIKRLRLNNLTLVGNSYGGGVALAVIIELLERKEDLISKLILIDSMGYPQRLPLFIKLLRIPFAGNIFVNTLPVSLQVKYILKLAYYDDEKIRDEDITAYAQFLRTSLERNVLLSTARQIVPEDIDSFLVKYPEIKIPTLIIWGEFDEIIPVSIGELLNNSLPNSQLHIIEDCGHIPQEERPKETLELIEDFLTLEH